MHANLPLHLTIQFLLVCHSVRSLHIETSIDENIVHNKSHRKHNIRIDNKWRAPRAIYGVGFHVEGVDDHNPKKIADFYFENYLKLLKVATADDLEYFKTRKTPSGATVRYIQKHEGIEVYDSGIAVTVNKNDTVSFVVSEFKPEINIPSIFPKILEEVVVDTALREIGVSKEHITFLKTSTVVYVEEDMQVLAWKILISVTNEKVESLEFLYDATSGENIHIKNMIVEKKGGGDKISIGKHVASNEIYHLSKKQKKNLRVNVKAKERNMQHKSRLFGVFKHMLRSDSNTCRTTVDVRACVFDPNPLASARASYGDIGGLRDNLDRSSPRLQEQLQTVTLEGITMIDNEYHLIGKYAQVEDFDFPLDGTFTRPKRCDYLGSRDEDFFEAVNAYYHIDTYMRYLHEDLKFEISPRGYEGGIKFDAHAANMMDNSYYDQLQERLGFGEGGVDDAEDADVVIHELAHFIHQSLTSDNMSINEGFAEGFGDYVAASYSRSKHNWREDDLEYNWVFAWDGHNEFWPGRITNAEGSYPDSLVGVGHLDGQIFSTCAMKIWDKFGRRDTDKIIFTGISYTGSRSNQEDAANAIVTAAQDLGYGSNDVDTIRKIMEGCGYVISV